MAILVASCEAAAVRARDVEIGVDELRAAMRAPSDAFLARKLATDERREAVRARLRSIVRLGEASMPELARELRLLLDEPMPEDAADNPLWTALCRSLVQRLEPAFNRGITDCDTLGSSEGKGDLGSA
jgi:hypothetical protein